MHHRGHREHRGFTEKNLKWFSSVLSVSSVFSVVVVSFPSRAAVLDAEKILARQTFWDNRDFAWYAANIPLFESPDPDLDTTYYYRWELVTKHLVYASPDT